MKTILVPVDFSDVTARVIATARQFASAFDARIILLHVTEPQPDFVGFEPGPITVRTDVAAEMRAEHQRLEQLKGEAGENGIEITALQVQGVASQKIIDEAGRQNTDLIVVGSHGHGALYHLLVGGVTEAVLKAAKCPVVIVPASVR